jgi:hypothetical protein
VTPDPQYYNVSHCLAHSSSCLVLVPSIAPLCGHSLPVPYTLTELNAHLLLWLCLLLASITARIIAAHKGSPYSVLDRFGSFRLGPPPQHHVPSHIHLWIISILTCLPPHSTFLALCALQHFETDPVFAPSALGHWRLSYCIFFTLHYAYSVYDYSCLVTLSLDGCILRLAFPHYQAGPGAYIQDDLDCTIPNILEPPSYHYPTRHYDIFST